MKIGDRIKQRRIELNLSQEELAKRMGYTTRSAICKVENGDDNITTTRVRKFAKALNCTESYLMGWEDINGQSINYVPNYEPDIQELLEMYSKLTTEQKHQVLALLRSFVN